MKLSIHATTLGRYGQSFWIGSYFASLLSVANYEDGSGTLYHGGVALAWRHRDGTWAPSMRLCNDMPVALPTRFDTLELVPEQSWRAAVTVK